jgi:hypothetical protein
LIELRYSASVEFLIRWNALPRLLRNTEAGILFNEHIAEDGPIAFGHACRLGAEGIVSKNVDGTYRSGPCRVWIKVRNPASIAVQRDPERIGTDDQLAFPGFNHAATSSIDRAESGPKCELQCCG